MSQPSVTRRGLLATAGVVGAARLAGCATVERVTLRGAVAAVPAVPRGLRVTDDHRRAARDRLDGALADIRSLVEATEARDGRDEGPRRAWRTWRRAGGGERTWPATGRRSSNCGRRPSRPWAGPPTSGPDTAT